MSVAHLVNNQACYPGSHNSGSHAFQGEKNKGFPSCRILRQFSSQFPGM